MNPNAPTGCTGSGAFACETFLKAKRTVGDDYSGRFEDHGALFVADICIGDERVHLIEVVEAEEVHLSDLA